jgi:transposase
LACRSAHHDGDPIHRKPLQAVPLDRRAYKRRNTIERLFCRLKNWRRIATRYDRLARNYLAGLALVSAVTAWT